MKRINGNSDLKHKIRSDHPGRERGGLRAARNRMLWTCAVAGLAPALHAASSLQDGRQWHWEAAAAACSVAHPHADNPATTILGPHE